MDTRTLAANLRQAIAGCGDYHIERWGRELADRAEELQRVVDARQTRHNAARGAVVEERDTEPATDETARETELQGLKNENAWLREEWLRLLDSMGREDAHRILDMDDDGADAPSTVVLDELWKQRVATTALCAEVARMEPAKETERKCESCKWFDRDEPRSSYDVGWDGECHRYPEPSTHDDDDWCGEWEER